MKKTISQEYAEAYLEHLEQFQIALRERDTAWFEHVIAYFESVGDVEEANKYREAFRNFCKTNNASHARHQAEVSRSLQNRVRGM